MSNSPIPPTESGYVAQLAIAWEITEKLYSTYLANKGRIKAEDGVEWLTKTFIRVQRALQDGEWKEEATG